ncbi:hypothetical protein [Agaribacterium haliotis]|uniref:hypothetical protein n=1 Tax=Agaribacterium haliotis TaxID=2013869 RepID=UPI000BB560CB|nr:hypothetical protein [Agaribacterium haliotis]
MKLVHHIKLAFGIATLCVAAFSLSPSCAFADSAASKQPPFGMESLTTEHLQKLYLANSFAAPSARSVFIEPPGVEFSSSWINEHGHTTSPTYQRVTKENYGKNLVKELKKSLKNNDWKTVSNKDKAAVVLKPRLFDLNIFSPEQSPTRQTIIFSFAGSAALQLDFYNEAGELFMRIVDKRDTPEFVGSPITNRSNNLLYFKVLMNYWAVNSSAYLEHLMRGIEAEQAPSP